MSIKINLFIIRTGIFPGLMLVLFISSWETLSIMTLEETWNGIFIKGCVLNVFYP